MKNKLRLAAAALAAAAVLALVGSTQASARDLAAAPANSVNSASIVDNQVAHADLKDGDVWESDMAPVLVTEFRKVYNSTVGTPQLKDGATTAPKLADGSVTTPKLANDAVTEPKLSPDVRAKLNAPDVDTDTKGDLTSVTLAPKVIDLIGGRYFGDTAAPEDNRFTTIGTFTLPAGTWLVNTSVKFTRTTAGVAGVRPQVGLRIGQGTASPDWGTDLGTVGGEDISKIKNKDLWGQSVQSVTVAEPTVVGVYGHGYTDTEGTEGSGEISAAVQVFLQRG